MNNTTYSQGLGKFDTEDLLELISSDGGVYTQTNNETLLPEQDHYMVQQHQQQNGQFHGFIEAPTYPHLKANPSLEDEDTAHEFAVDVPMEQKDKKQWYFDPFSKKLFVKAEQPLSAHITYKTFGPEKFNLRLMPVYTSLADVFKPVNRCANHKAKSRSEIGEHIVQCHHEGARYVGKEVGVLFQDRLSVLIPLRESIQSQNYPMVLKEEINFSFMCLNTCSGISRRNTALIITLESECGQILGRKVMNFKSCTSPKRDFEHDCKKRGLPNAGLDAAGQPSAKRPMIVKNPDGTPQTVVKVENEQSSQESGPPASPSRGRALTLNLPDNETCLHMLYQTQDFLSGEVTRGKAVSKEYFKQISKQIKEIQGDIDKAKGS